MKHGYSRFAPIITFVLDLVILNVAISIASFFHFGNAYFIVDNNIGELYFIANCSWIIIALLSQNYVFQRPLILSDSLSRLIPSFAYHMVCVFGSLYFLRIYDVSRDVLIYSYFLFFVFILIQRSTIFFAFDYLRKRGFNQIRVVLLGDTEIAARIKKSFKNHPEYGYFVSAVLPKDTLQAYSQEDINEIVEKYDIDEIYLCYKNINNKYVDDLLSWFSESQIKIKVVSDLVIDPSRTELIRFNDFPVLRLFSNPIEDLKIKIIKRSFDITFSTAIMVGFMPAFMLVFIGTWLSSKGPVFYIQQRIGRNGKAFYMYKFRTMYCDSEKSGPQLSCDNDPRITPWGKLLRRTHLDELPQFYNVFVGDMSVVGPRPERQYFIEKIIERAPQYKKLLSVRPGITSIGQIKYGYAENVDQMLQRMRYDLIYLNRHNFKMDMGIITQTLVTMVQAKGK